MKRAKEIFIKIFNPHYWLVILFLALSFVGLFLLLFGHINQIALYFMYALWFYTLLITITWIIRIVKKSKDVYKNSDSKAISLLKRYKEDKTFSGVVSICIGLATSSLYVIYRLVLAVLYSSTWFLKLMVYYLILAILRGFLLYMYMKKNRDSKREIFAFNVVSWMLLVLNIAMAGVSVLIIKNNEGFSYPGYIIYISAAYSFYAIIVSIINVVKYKRLGSPILSASKVLTFIAAMVSIFALQTAMLNQFGSDASYSFKLIINSVTGGAIALITILTSIYMIVRSQKLRKELLDE